MYDYSVYNTLADEELMSTAATMVGFGMAFWIIGLIISLFLIISMWKLFSKSGRPGWAAIIPIYNIIVLLDIAGLEWYYLILMIIPIVNIYAMFKIYIELAHSFGKSTGFGVAMVFFSIICIPIIAFGSAEYEG